MMTDDAIEVLVVMREPRKVKQLRAALQAVSVPVHALKLNH